MNAADPLRHTAVASPAKPGLVFRGRPIAYGDLDDRVDRTAAALAKVGVGPGDRVALLAGNVPEFVSTLYGAMRAGAVVCPLNYALTPDAGTYTVRAILPAGWRLAAPSAGAYSLTLSAGKTSLERTKNLRKRSLERKKSLRKRSLGIYNTISPRLPERLPIIFTPCD